MTLSLEKLCLSKISLHTLPDSIGKVSNLEVFLVSQTTIVNLPSSLGILEKFKIIDTSYCRNLKGEIFSCLQKTNTEFLNLTCISPSSNVM